MNLAVRKNGDFPSLLLDFFSPSSLISRDLFDLDKDLFRARLGINVML